MKWFRWLQVLLVVVLFWAWNFIVPEFLSEDAPSLIQRRISRSWPTHPDPSVVILGIDDQVYAQNRFNRLEHAHVIDLLTEAGVRQIFFDLTFDEPRGPQFDIPLAEAVARSRRVILAGGYQAQADVSDDMTRPILIPELQKLVQDRLCRLAIINASNTGDKLFSALAYLDTESGPINPWGAGLRLSPAASLLTAYRHLDDGAVELVEANWRRGPLVNIPPQSFEVDPLILAHPMGSQPTIIGYRIPVVHNAPASGPSGKLGGAGTIPIVPYLKVADGDPETLARMRDKFVLVGDTSSRDDDVYDTPVGRIKGVEIHANLFNALLLNRVPTLPLSGSAFGRFCDLLALGLVLVSASLLSRQGSLRNCLALAVVLLVLWEATVWAVDHTGYFLPRNAGERSLIFTLTLVLFLRYLVSAKVLGTFIPAEVVQQLLRGEEIVQGPVHATVMVTDIRGYTTLSESRTPAEVLTLLNDYHTETVRHYKKYGGHVLNYQGDAQIVLFGHPRKQADPALQAIRAAQGASAAVEALRRHWKLPEGQSFNVGAGICTGKVVIADLGGDQREYTVIGELVRKAHKLQSQSEVLGANIILDEATFLECQQKPEVVRCDGVVLDGLPDPVTVYITDLIPGRNG